MKTVTNATPTGVYGQSLTAQLAAAKIELETKQTKVDELEANLNAYSQNPILFENLFSTATTVSKSTAADEKAEALKVRNAKSNDTRSWTAKTRAEQLTLITDKDPLSLKDGKLRKVHAE
jgi:hypothetical protein